MEFLRTLLQAEADAELLVQRFFVVAHDIETAALGGAFRPEGTHDDVASGPNRGSNLSNVGRALLRHGQEVKHGAVVPHVVSVKSTARHSASVSSRTVAGMGFLLGEFRSAVTSRSGDKFIESRFTSRQRTHQNGLMDTVQSDVVRLMFLIRFCAQVLESRW
jgi:hypothetical protein